jgi:selenocysteine lyase/cysteine desulfurase
VLDALSVRAELAERHIHVSVRGPAIRVSPHVYNDAADLARLSSALRELVRTH